MPNQELSRYSTTNPFFYGYVVVIVACIMVLSAYGAFYSFGIFFKPILTEFGWTRAMTSGAFSLSTILQGIVAIIAGGLTDRFGPRVIITLGGLSLGIGYLLMSQINSIWQLYLFYGVMVGTGMGGFFVALLSTVARWFVKRRGLMTGIVTAGIGLGVIIVPPIANWLITNYDWRISYLILGTTVLALILPSAQFLRRDPTQMGQMPYGQKEIEEQQSQIETNSASFKRATGTWQLWVVCAIFLCFGFCLLSIMVHIAPHTTDLGISTASAANIVATIGIVSIVGKVATGYLIDRIGSRAAWIISFIAMAIALFWLLVTGEMWMFYTFAVIFGFAYGAGVIAQSPLIAELFGLDSHGAILGLALFCFHIGAAIGPLQTGYIFDVYSSYQTAFLICGLMAVLGFILAVLLKPVSDEFVEKGIRRRK